MTSQAESETSMPLSEHLDELRRRVLWALAGLAVCVAAAMCFGGEILSLLEQPYRAVMTSRGGGQLLVLKAADGFLIYMRVSLIAGLILASPWVFYQFWAFVAAGLHQREKRYAILAVPCSAGLFVAGAAFFLFVAAVPLMRFFLAFNDSLGLATTLTLGNHIAMMTGMMLAFGLGFQMPLVVALLGAMGLVSPGSLGKYRRHVIVILLIFAALVTSPSPIDQIALALPMWLLYELGILLVKLGNRQTGKKTFHGFRGIKN